MRLVIFDLDGTLLSGDSDFEWMNFLMEEGIIDRRQAERANEDTMRRYQAGEISAEDFCRFYLGLLKAQPRERLDALHARYMASHIMPIIRPKGRELVANHRAQGDLLVMSTATSRFLTAPIAAELGFEHLIATEPAVSGGFYTGDFDGIANMREGKVARLDSWIEAQGQGWEIFSETWFYSDSRNDIPLLSHVSHPVAVDPDETLAGVARERGWPVVSLL